MRSRRLPGIEFVAVPPALPEALPRMDIAVFVGFASTGPLHIPVAVESTAEYTNVFGADAPLAWDVSKGERMRAHLGPSVRAFFSNGGRRCWVIRVARSEALAELRLARGLDTGDAARAPVATYNRFPLPGLVTAGGKTAYARARCEGSWSDGLLVDTALQERAISLDRVEAGDKGTLAITTRGEVVPGDVVRLADGDGLLVFGRVGKVELAGRARHVTLDPVVAFRDGSNDPVPLPAGSPYYLFTNARVLTFDLRVRGADESGVILAGLGLAAGHPRDWNVQPTDHDYFRVPVAETQRFPLAASGEDAWLIPLGVGANFGPALGAEKPSGSALERDGLSVFDPSLFLDPDLEPWQPGVPLISPGIDVLAQDADFRRYTSTQPRRLFGIHAALGHDAGLSEEGTLVCVPDAVHYGWEKAPPVAPRAEPAPPPQTVQPEADLFTDCEPQAGAQPRWTSPPWTSPPAPDEPPPIEWHSLGAEGFAGDGRVQALIDIQRALLRMCAAKGELFAVLSLPAHFREREAIAHAARLGPVRAETAPATYGALYHPWPVDRREDGVYYAFPPDGPVMGVLAARAFDRGAWIAPANEVMKDFVALAPAIRMEWWPALLDAQVNVLRQDPRGFLLMSEDTLAGAADADLRPICVRRLLILLRRLALRRGANYVFEPHDDTLRRTVHRAFHATLSDLFARGAFAGRTPELSFQVITDDTINTPQSTELGRFFVDIKVAPSLPMTFLTVRLRQVGERLTASEGR